MRAKLFTCGGIISVATSVCRHLHLHLHLSLGRPSCMARSLSYVSGGRVDPRSGGSRGRPLARRARAGTTAPAAFAAFVPNQNVTRGPSTSTSTSSSSTSTSKGRVRAAGGRDRPSRTPGTRGAVTYMEATVDGDPGPASPGLDAAGLLIRGNGVEGDDLVTTLTNAGLTREQCAEVLTKHPQVTGYDLVHEVQPRINYIKFLGDNDRLDGETVGEFVTRAPQVLERRFELVHECENYAVVNKPWCVRLDTPRGWPGKVRFTPKYPGDLSVEDWLERRYPNWDTVRFCHQLDNATSGILVSASNKRAAGAAAKLFRERKAKKTYLAIVFGHPEHDEWSVNAPLARDPTDPKGFREMVDEAEGKACETRFRVLQRGTCALEGKFEGVPVAKVQVTPVTGRRHQIRVHLAHSGHPIVGDNAYSEDTDSFRTFLHAHVLEMPFEPPKGVTKKEVWVTRKWVAPEPASFAAAIK